MAQENWILKGNIKENLDIMKHLKLYLLTCILVVSAFAGHLDTGYTFDSGETNITYSKLNSAVNDALLNLTGFPVDTSVDGANDYIVFYDASASTWNRVVPNNLVAAETYYTVSIQTGTSYNVPDTNYIVLCNNTATMTVALLTASSEDGKRIVIKRINTGSVVIDPNGSETIDGESTITLGNQWDSVLLVSDGTNWQVGAKIDNASYALASELTDGSVTKLGTSTVGSTSKPIYLNSGVATALSATVGSTSKPVYLNSGTLTALSATVGSSSQPVYMNSGTIAAITGTIANNISGNAATATSLATSRNISLTGDATGSASFNGTANASITVTVANDSHTHDTRYYTKTEVDALLPIIYHGIIGANGVTPITPTSYNGSITFSYVANARFSVGFTDLGDTDYSVTVTPIEGSYPDFVVRTLESYKSSSSVQVTVRKDTDNDWFYNNWKAYIQIVKTP